jgi:hypothetical protein
MNTKERILSETLYMLNKHGIDSVSTVDIAKKLKIRQSNITYYFPTKLDLISTFGQHMVEEVNEAVRAVVIDPQKFDMIAFYHLMSSAMKVHQKYKFLFLNYANIVTSNKKLHKYFVNLFYETRFDEFGGIVNLLHGNKILINKDLLLFNGINMFVANILGIYWIQESAIYHADKTEDEQRHHHIKVYFATYYPYLSKKGKKQFNELFDE